MPYDDGLPFVPGSETSRRAAVAAKSIASTQRERVHAHLRNQGRVGATCDELSAALSITNQSLCPRIRELHEQSLIAKLTEVRLTRSKRDAFVLVAPEFVDGRETIPFVPYRLIRIDQSVFDEVFAEFDPTWRAHRWLALELKSRAKDRR